MSNYSNEVVTLWYRAPDVLLGNIEYMTTIDIWSIGCIFAEMVTGKTLFNGINDKDHTKRIFKILGTPNYETYPNINKLPEYKHNMFDDYPRQNLKTFVPGLEEKGIDLLERMLRIDPEKRITSYEALEHPYFDEIKEDFIKNTYKK